MSKLNKLVEEYKKKHSDNIDDIFRDLIKQEGYEWAKGVSKNQMIDAEVVSIDNKNEKVEIRTGLKSNSFVPFREFKNNEEQKIPEVGSTISVIFEGIDSQGRVFVSYKKVKFEERLKEIEQIFNNKQTVEGTVLYKQKVSSSNQYKNNSYVVDLGYGVIALVVPDGFTELEQGKKITAYVNRFDTKRFGIILGLKVVNDGVNVEQDHKSYDSHSQLKEGEIMELKVAEYKDFGILCNKVSGGDELYFVNNTELTLNKRIRKKHEVITLYPLGKVFKAIVIAIKDNQGNKKLILSARELFKDLMHRFIEAVKDKQDQKFDGIITEKRESELIVKIEYEGNILEGKLHRDDLSWSMTNAINEFRSLAVGDKIVVGINFNELNMSAMDTEYGFLPFSVKVLSEDPFKSAIENIKIGQIYPCTFVSYNDYGALMSLKIGENQWTDNNVDILLQIKELKELSRETNTKQGAVNQAKVTKIDPQIRRVYVSIKSAEQDDIDKYSAAAAEAEQNTSFNTLHSMSKKKK